MEEKAIAVIDTSLYISAFMSNSKTSAPAKVIQSLREGNFSVVISPQILQEILEISKRENVKQEKIIHLLEDAKKKNSLIIIEGIYVSYKLDNIDIDDNIILAAALESKADYIITLDKEHIQPIKHYYGTQIVNPNYFMNQLKTHTKAMATIFSR